MASTFLVLHSDCRRHKCLEHKLTWVSIPKFEGRYEVSIQGEIRSLVAPGGPRILKPQVNKSNGYWQVGLYDSKGKRHSHEVHRLVAAAFLGPLPEGMCTRHLNSDLNDNRVSNLSYGTYSDNNLDTIRNGKRLGPRPKETCRNGHSYLDNPPRITPEGKTVCRPCFAARAKRWRTRASA